MDTTSTRKRSRPSVSGGDDEGALRKTQAIATECLTVTSPTAPSSDAVADEHSVTHDSDGTNETEFQTTLFQSQKRRQRALTSPGPAANIDPAPGSTYAALSPCVVPASLPAFSPGLPIRPLRLRRLLQGVIAAADIMLPFAMSPWDSGTLLFRPANTGASFHHTSHLPITQDLSALPRVKEVGVKSKMNIGAADASTVERMDRLLARSELAGIPVTARPPAERSQSSGVVQGVDSDYTD
ncbi:hypothetical protein MTO96_048712 [Rhipicephalus appendiculatus]